MINFMWRYFTRYRTLSFLPVFQLMLSVRKLFSIFLELWFLNVSPGVCCYYISVNHWAKMQGQSHKGKLHVPLNFIILLQIPYIQSLTNYFKGNTTISLKKKSCHLPQFFLSLPLLFNTRPLIFNYFQLLKCIHIF